MMNNETTDLTTYYKILDKQKMGCLTKEQEMLILSIDIILERAVLFDKQNDYLRLFEKYLDLIEYYFKENEDYQKIMDDPERNEDQEIMEEIQAKLNSSFSFKFMSLWKKTLNETDNFIKEVRQKRPLTIETNSKGKAFSDLIDYIFSIIAESDFYDSINDYMHDKDYHTKMANSILKTYNKIQELCKE